MKMMQELVNIHEIDYCELPNLDKASQLCAGDINLRTEEGSCVVS